MTQRRLNLVRGEALRRIVSEVVARSLKGPGDGRELADALTSDLISALRREGQSVRGMTKRAFLVEMERSNHELLQARDKARRELDELRKEETFQRQLLAETHSAVIRCADEGADGREQESLSRLNALMDAVARGELSVEDLRDEMSALVLESARRERRDILDAMTVERDRQVDMLERRIAKLNRSLELSEQAISDLASRKDVDEGIASIYRTVQGLSIHAPQAEKKRELLQEIFQSNVELREQLELSS
ncbi:MAG: hypothetical protein AAF682_02815 [Planctomycetota bacterium]